jgi:hypothetical protein
MKNYRFNKKNLLIIAACIIAAVLIILIVFFTVRAKITGNLPSGADPVKTTTRIVTVRKTVAVTDAAGQTVTDVSGQAVTQTVTVTQVITEAKTSAKGSSKTAGGSSGKTTAGKSSGDAAKTTSGTTAKPAAKTTAKTTAPTQGTTLSAIQTRIKSIYDTYGITVQTGSDADCYPTDHQLYGETDEKIINEWLDVFSYALDRYPQGIFRDMSDVTTVTVKLVSNDASDDELGVTSYEFGGSWYIALSRRAMNEIPSRVLYHEMFHFFDRYMYVKNGYSNALSATAAIVPAGFSWGFGQTDTAYTVQGAVATGDYSQLYFASAYGKSNEREDRAEIFDTYMIAVYQKDYMKYDSPMNRKMIIIANAMRKYFPSAARASKGSLQWEKYLA